jgi:hypothetical protein
MVVLAVIFLIQNTVFSKLGVQERKTAKQKDEWDNRVRHTARKPTVQTLVLELGYVTKY